jgi:hypothetical protein
VLGKLLAISALVLFVMRLLFRPQLKALGKWFDGVVNVLLVAIVLTYAIQLVVYFFRR